MSRDPFSIFVPSIRIRSGCCGLPAAAADWWSRAGHGYRIADTFCDAGFEALGDVGRVEGGMFPAFSQLASNPHRFAN